MKKNLPSRPNLEHLRRQAKALLAGVEAGETEAVETIQRHLPAASGMTAGQILGMRLRLADAQWAIARKTGFGNWPALARHVEQLRGLEGTWGFVRLEVGGSVIPAAALQASRVLIDGDRFRTESPEGPYEGVFTIDVEAQPHEIDIEFVAGPEAGNTNYGIFRLEGDQLEICLDMKGKPRPKKFGTAAGEAQAYEVLKRISDARPAHVTGGAPERGARGEPELGFEYIDSPTLAKLQGEWKAVRIIRDGQELPKMMLAAGRRSATKNEIRISFGGQVMIHALVRLNEKSDPVQVDYYNLDGGSKGRVQLGIFKWSGAEACFCMAAPGQPRPADFTCTAGSGRTFSQWRAIGGT